MQKSYKQVNFFQKHLILLQLTQNMTKDCSWSLQAQDMGEHVVCINCSEYQNKKQLVYTTCSELGNFMYWTVDSMNNLLSYCVLVDAKIRASDNYLPVLFWFKLDKHSIFWCKCKRKSSSINQLYTKLELPWCSMYYNTQSFAAISYTHKSITVGDFQLFWFTYDFD